MSSVQKREKWARSSTPTAITLKKFRIPFFEMPYSQRKIICSWVKQRLLEGVDFLPSSPLEYMTHT